MDLNVLDGRQPGMLEDPSLRRKQADQVECRIAKVLRVSSPISSPPRQEWSARGAWFPTVIASASGIGLHRAGLTGHQGPLGRLTPLNIHLSYSPVERGEGSRSRCCRDWIRDLAWASACLAGMSHAPPPLAGA